jgi:hypothetical protein
MQRPDPAAVEHGMRRVSISLVSVPADEGRKLNLRAIEGMAVALLLEQALPPVELLIRSDGHYDLCDGRHRFVAYLLAGRAHIDAMPEARACVGT